MNTIKLPNGNSIEGRRGGDKFSATLKTLAIFTSVVFGAGITWNEVNANAERSRANTQKVEAVVEQVNEGHETIIQIEKDVHYLRRDFSEYKIEQKEQGDMLKEQRNMLTIIVTELKAQ